MISSSELYWQYIQLEPEQQRPLRVRPTYPDRRKDPPRFTDEEVMHHLREEQWMQQQFEERNKEGAPLNYNP